MQLHSMGIAYRHGNDFAIDRPNGSGDNLLLIFCTAAYVVTAGEKRVMPAGSAILYSKGEPQIYGAVGAEYVNHWVHFDCAENDIFFDRAGTVFNTPVTAPSIADAEKVLEMLRLESLTDENEQCIDLLLRLLIAKSACTGGKSPNNPHSDRLRALRAEIYGNPAGRFTIGELAKKLSLSPTYFQTLYKNEFGVSCYEDILAAKTELAEYYLRNTALPVSAVAELCGYENDVHFMRQFRQRTGKTPSSLRKGEVTAGI